MTKKHFIKFAAEIKAQLGRSQAKNKVEIAENQAHLVGLVAKRFNSNFDWAKFQRACGLVE